MKPDSKKILETLQAACEEEQEKEKLESVKFVRNSDMVICIKVDDLFDPYALADRLEDILDDIPAVKDMIIFTR